MGIIAGVDGCRIGWVVAVHDLAAGTCRIEVHPSFAHLLDALAYATVIAVDIPIGLGDSMPRPTDIAARRFLGLRRSSVFPAPCRPSLSRATYESASELSFAASGKRLTKQTFAIIPRIREVDATLRTRGSAADRVVEVHPEVSFAVLNGDKPMAHPKKRSAGREERLELLAPIYQAAFSDARPKWLRKHVASDDLLDALVAAWSGGRVFAGTARSFPPPPVMRDSTGLPMRILA